MPVVPASTTHSRDATVGRGWIGGWGTEISMFDLVLTWSAMTMNSSGAVVNKDVLNSTNGGSNGHASDDNTTTPGMTARPK